MYNGICIGSFIPKPRIDRKGFHNVCISSIGVGLLFYPLLRYAKT